MDGFPNFLVGIGAVKPTCKSRSILFFQHHSIQHTRNHFTTCLLSLIVSIMARPKTSKTVSPKNPSGRSSPRQAKGVVCFKTYKAYVLKSYITIYPTENVPLRSNRSNKGKGGRAEQLTSLLQAIRPGEFDGSDKTKKTSKSKVPASAPVNPMAPAEKKRRAKTKVSTREFKTVTVNK